MPKPLQRGCNVYRYHIYSAFLPRRSSYFLFTSATKSCQCKKLLGPTTHIWCLDEDRLGWRLISAHIIPLKSAHRLFFIYLPQMRTHDSPQIRTHRLHSSLNNPMLPQTQMRTHDSPHLRTHQFSHDDLFLLIASFD